MSFTHNEQRAAAFQRQRQQAQQTLHTSSRRTYEQLRASIRAGLSGEDTQFRELDISKDFGASRNSVRAALAMLAADGLISRGPRNGTVVTRDILDFPIDRVLPRDFESRYSSGVHGLVIVDVESAILSMTTLIAELLQSTAERIVTYVQLALYDDEPLYVRSGVAPLTFDPAAYLAKLREGCEEVNAFAVRMAALDAEAAARLTPDMEMESMFTRLHGVAFGHSKYRAEVVGADTYIAELLNVAENSPVILRQQINYDENNVAREFSFTHYRGDRASLTITRTRSEEAGAW
jgi:GntR family transcriptional regulator